jgi:virulence-associated protein VagC
MDTAKLFLLGHCQVVRLPQQYRFPGNDVAVKHFGNGVLLLPIDETMPMPETTTRRMAAPLFPWTLGVFFLMFWI